MDQNQPPRKVGLLGFLRDSNGVQFVIPVYQRNYTWTASKEVCQYFEDLKCVLNGKYDKHFLGIIIYLDIPLDYSSREFSVIDGQQRLTTTFLILYAIKKLMLEMNLENDAKKLEGQYLINQFVDDKLKFKLKPLVSDDNVYKQIVEGVEDSFSEEDKKSNVFKNYIYILDTLKELLKTYSFNDILMSLDKLYVVCVPVSFQDSPQKIFESINSTGAKLTSSDLIRNFVLMDIKSDDQESFYFKYWKKIEDLISNESKKLELFFRMFLAVKLQTLPSTSVVYPLFKYWFQEQRDLGVETEDILKEIVSYARYYNYIYLKPIDTVDKDLRDAIKDFRNNLSEMPAPLLMELYNLYSTPDDCGNTLISANQFTEIINILNSYLIRRSICDQDTSAITKIFPYVLKDVVSECSGDFSNIVEIFKKQLVNKQRGKAAAMPTDDEMRIYLSTANVYNNRVTLRVIFNKLETVNNPAPVDLSKLSVEHLMPQTPTKEWLDLLKIDADTYEANLHRLGNLTLAEKGDNSTMKNKPFEYKKEILKSTSHLKMNIEILEKSQWTLAEIEERNRKLIEDIILLYPYTQAKGNIIKKHDIVLKADGITALGTFYEEDGAVEIEVGSEIKPIDEYTPSWCVDIINSLLEDEIIKENDKGYIFVMPYVFVTKTKNGTSLSASAGVMLGGNRNGWDYWLDDSGKPLNQNKVLVKLFKKTNE